MPKEHRSQNLSSKINNIVLNYNSKYKISIHRPTVILINKEIISEFLDGPVVKTWHLQCCGPRFNPLLGTSDPASCRAWPKKKKLREKKKSLVQKNSIYFI